MGVARGLVLALLTATGCSLLSDLDSLGAGDGLAVVPVADASVVDSAPVEGGEPLPTSIEISPATVQLGESRNVRFATTTEATFTIEEGEPGGRVDSSGLYVAPSKSGTFTVVATSTKNPVLTAKAIVTVVPLKVEIVAGRYGGMGTADGPLKYSHFRAPTSVFADLDGDHVYVSDPTSSTVRVIDRAQNRVDTYAGKVGENLFVNGPSDVARLRDPQGLLEADGGVFVFGDDCVRRIDKATKVITTFAGSCGEAGSVDGIGSAARLSTTSTVGRYGGVAVFCEGSRLKTIDITTAQVKTIANLTDTCMTGPHAGPTKAVFLEGATVKTFDGVSAGTIATIATVPSPPTAVCASQSFALVASSDRVLRQIDLTTKAVTVLAGQNDNLFRAIDGTIENARFLEVRGMTCSYVSGFGGGFAGYLTDTSTVRTFTNRLFGDGVVTLNAPAIRPAVVDGDIDVGSFMKPARVAVDANRNVYVGDIQFLEAANVIRRIDGKNGDLSTFAGALSIAPIIGPGTPAKDGTADSAVFNIPISITIGEKDLFVADFIGSAVRRVSLETRRVDTLAGSLGVMGFVNDVGIRSQFRFVNTGPQGVIGGYVTTEGDSVIVGDTGNFALRSVTIATGATSTLAGGTRGVDDGIGVNAKFEDVKGVFGSGDGKIYVLDRERLRVVDVATREVKTLAGVTGELTPVDGTFTTARFGYFVAGGYDRAGQAIYVSEGIEGSTVDTAFPVIRRIDLVAKTVTTVVGTRGQIGLAPLPLPTTLGCPTGLSVAPNGDVFFADYCDSVVAVLKSL